MGIVFDQSLNTTDSPTFNSLKTDTILSDAANLSVSNRMTINAGHQTNLAVMTLNCAAGTGGLKLQNGSRSFQIGNNLNHTRPHFVRITNIGLRFSHGGAVSNGEAPFLFSGDLNSANSTSAVIGITTGGDGGLLEGLNSSGVRTSLLRSDGSFESYNTYTDASNYERGVFKWDSNVLTIGTEALGTGSTRDITITSNRQLNLKSTSATYLYNPGSPSAYLWIANFSLKPNTANDWDLGEPNNLLRFNNIYGRTLYAYTTYIQSSAGATRWVLDGDNNLISQNVTGGPHLGSTPPYSFVGDTSTGLDTDGSGTLIAIANADTFEQRNGTTAQTFNVYNTYTDASNYERGYLKWEGSILKLGNESLGTGVERSLYIESSVDLRLSCGSGDTISFYPANTNSFGMNASRFYSVSEQYLGSSSFRFGNVYSVDGDFTGTVNIGTGSSSNVGGMILSSNGGTHTIDVSSNVLEIRSYNVIKMIDGASTVFQTSGSAVTAASCKFPRGAHFSALGANYLTSVFQGYSGQNRDLSEWRDSSDAKLLTIGATGDLSLYNTYTDASNYERGVFKWDSNALTIGTESLGTGTGRAVRFIVNGVDYGGISTNGRWQLGAGAANSSSVNIGGDNVIHFKDSATAFIDTGVSSPLQLRPQGVVAMRLNTDQSIDVYQRMTIFGTDVASSSTIPPISITKTYNQTATAGSTDLLINRTETALGSGSHYFADFQVGGVSKVSIENDGTVEMYDNVIHFHEAGGQIRFQRWTSIPTQFGYIGRDVANGPIVYDSGSWSGAGHTFAGVGTFRQELQTTYFANAAPKLVFQSSSGSSGDFTGNSPFSFDSGYAGGTAGFVIKNAAARKVEVDSNGDLFVFNSYTDASNYERGVIKWDTNVLTIGTEALGTGTVRDIEFVGGNFGIGIAPAILFDVYGTGNQYGRLKSTSDMTLIIDSGVSNESGLRFRRGGNNKAVVYLGASDILYFDVGGTDALTIDSLQQTTILHTGVSSSGTDNPFTITPTYNQTGTAGSTDLLINRTETAVGSGDQNLMDLQVGGTSKFKVNNAGMVTTAGGNGSGTAGGLMLGNSIGWISRGTGSVELASGSAEYIEMASDGITLRTGNSFGWSANNNPQDGSGPRLWENTTDERIELRRGTTALGFAVANTWTDASNSEFGVFDWTTTANTLTIGTQAAGTGTLRAVNFVASRINYTGDIYLSNNPTIYFDGAHASIGENAGNLVLDAVNSVVIQSDVNSFKFNTVPIHFTDGGSTKLAYTRINSNQADLHFQNETTTGGVYFDTFTMYRNGNVGFGTTIPTARMSLVSSAQIGSSGVDYGFDINNTYNQTATAGSTDLLIDRTETALGSGTHNFFEFRVGGALRSKMTNSALLHFSTSVDSGIAWNQVGAGRVKASITHSSTGNDGSILFNTTTDTGIVRERLRVNHNGEIILASASALSWNSDTYLLRQSANNLAQRNGTNAQTLNIYNTYTDASNYERGIFDWTTTANTLTIGTEAAGTGTARAIDFSQGGTVRFSIAASLLRINGDLRPWNASGNLGGSSNRWQLYGVGATFVKTYTSSSGTDNPLSVTPTYNQTGTAGSTDLLINRTETALGSGSHYLADFQVGGVSQFQISNIGKSYSQDGDVSRPAYSFLNDVNAGMYSGGDGSVWIASNGVRSLRVKDGQVLAFATNFGIGNSDSGGQVNLHVVTDDILEQRDGTNAQEFRLYNTYTDASNYERAVLDWTTTANTLTIGTQKAGTGAGRRLSFIMGGTEYAQLSPQGRWMFGAGAVSSGIMNIGGDRQIWLQGGNSAIRSPNGFMDVKSGTGVAAIRCTGETIRFNEYDGGGTFSFRAHSTAARTIVIGRRTSQTGDLFHIKDESSNEFFSIDYYGRTTFTGGDSIAASSNDVLVNLLRTYNQTGTAGSTDLLINRTETALGSGDHYFADFQVGGTAKFNIDNTGSIYSASGLYNSDTTTIQFKLSNAAKIQINSNNVTIRGNNLQFNDSGGTNHTKLVPGTGTLEQQQGTAAQSFYVSNTFTNGSNYERAIFGWDTNVLTIGTEALGTGADRSIRITRRSDTEYYELVNAQHTFVANSKTMRYTGTALYPTGLTDLGDPSNSRSWPNAYIENIFSYNSYTDASNYERGVFKWDSNVLTIGTEALGTGTDRAVEFIGSAFDFSSTVTVPQLDVGPTGAKIDYAANKLYVIGYTGTLFRNQADTASGDAFQFTGNTNIQLTAASGSQRYIGIDAEINQSGTAGYDLIGGNVTETATGSGTKNLIDLKVGGSSKFSVTNAGKVHSNAGTSVISYESQFANYGIGFNNNGEACAVINSSAKTKIGWNVITSGNVGLTGTAGYNMSADVILERDAANTLALRNGANNQRLNIYDSYTDGSNYVRGFLRGSGSGYFQLGTEALGTGVEQNLSIMTSGTERIRISPSGRINLFKTITPITAVAGVDLGLVNSPFDLAFINQIYSYNSYTDASNYERGVFKWDTNELIIGTEALGTGVNRDVKFVTGNKFSFVGDGTDGVMEYYETGTVGYFVKTSGVFRTGCGNTYASFSNGSSLTLYANNNLNLQVYPSSTRCVNIGRTGIPSAMLHVAGDAEFDSDVTATGISLNVETFTSTDTLDANNHVCLCDTTSGFTLNLPAAASHTGRIYQIKKTSADGNAVTIDGSGAETIDGSTTISITTQYESVTIVSDGTNWFII